MFFLKVIANNSLLFKSLYGIILWNKQWVISWCCYYTATVYMCLHFVRACTDDSNEKKMQANSFQGQHRSPWQNIW